MSHWVMVNGAKIEKQFLEENIAEAMTYQWIKSNWVSQDQDHSHCIICIKAIPDKPALPAAIYYQSSGGWLCQYCYEKFLFPPSQE